MNTRLIGSYILIALVAALSGCKGAYVVVEKPKQNGQYSLKPSENKRYLVNHKDAPVYLLGGTAWTMPENCTREDVDFYLNDRIKKGFNYVQIVAVRDLGLQSIENQIDHGTMNPKNRYGFRPFEWGKNNKADVSKPIVAKGGTPLQPNDYWDHLDYIIQRSAELNLFIGLLPTWGKYYINNKKPEMRIFSKANAKSYGKFLGNRYKTYKHIIWIMGGDIPADKYVDGRPLYRSMAEGIAEGVSGKTAKWNKASPVWDKLLISYHGRNAAADYFNNDAWLKLNMIYEDDPLLHENVIANYSNTPVRPIIEGEAWYEGWVWTGAYKSAQVMRRQMYHTFFGGALGGYVYGVAMSTKNAGDQVLKFRPGWKDKLDLEAANDVRHLRTLLDELPWWKLEPDQSIIKEGIGNGETLKAACKTTDGNLILVYFSDQTPAVIDLTRIIADKTVKATWFNPCNGKIKKAGIFTANQAKSFVPPSGWTDSILIIKGKDIEY